MKVSGCSWVCQARGCLRGCPAESVRGEHQGWNSTKSEKVYSLELRALPTFVPESSPSAHWIDLAPCDHDPLVGEIEKM